MDKINTAFHKIERANFLPMNLRYKSDLDAPISIGYGQTNSQPSTVRQMLEWLGPKTGERILDIGSGSGWTTALMAEIVGPSGEIYAVEKIPELVKFGLNNCQDLGITNVHFYQSGVEYGLPKYAPFDRILVSAAAQKLPNEVISQLKIGGKLVIPVNNDILEITKITDTKNKIIKHSGYIFVPLL